MIILPGGMPGSENLDHSRVVDAALRAGAKNGAYLCAICAAPMVLGKRGYLQGKRAVCYPGFEEYLDGARVTDARVECDGKVITSKGMGAALEFGLALVEVLCGKEKAEQISGAVFAK
jgi:4-methyl-5(b-hydroxyethyl)-thiazole monophosphate biosynthesis